MAKECVETIQKIIDGFRECRNAFTAIGDETRPSVSHHLQILKNSGIVSMRKEGTKNYYSLSIDGTQWKNMSALINLIYEGVQRIETREHSKQKEKDA